jgi:hypothetical protein
MEQAFELANYLPLSYRTESEQDYIRFLWEAFESNYENGKYQFAFLAYHMLTMSFVYFNIWQIKQARPEEFSISLLGFAKEIEKDLLEATTPFTFWRVNESHVMRFLKLIGCDNSEIRNYADLVKDRNNTAHTNGQLFLNSAAALDRKIAQVLRIVEEIQTHSKPIILRCYDEFLNSSRDEDTREYESPHDQVREVLIHGHYFSQKDVDFCLEIPFQTIVDMPDSEPLRDLHGNLILYYSPNN